MLYMELIVGQLVNSLFLRQDEQLLNFTRSAVSIMNYREAKESPTSVPMYGITGANRTILFSLSTFFGFVPKKRAQPQRKQQKRLTRAKESRE